MESQHIFIDKCIYCGGEGQTDEHIIPLALGGKIALQKASCEKCREITSRYERNPLNENWSGARAVLDYPSRRRDFDKETFPLDVTLKSGERTTLNLKRSETVGFAPFLEYPLPVFFSGDKKYKSGITLFAHRLIGFGSEITELVSKYSIKDIHYQVKHKSQNFELMVARIAYCAAVGRWGLDALGEKFVLPAILGQKDDIGYWLGCDLEAKILPRIGKINAPNVIKLAQWRKNDKEPTYIVAQIKFFAASDAPEYIVVVGALADTAPPKKPEKPWRVIQILKNAYNFLRGR